MPVTDGRATLWCKRMPGNDAGMRNEQDLGVLDEADAGQDAALSLDANPPDDCGEQRCGDGVCA